MTPYDCQFLRDRLRGKAYLPLAYFEGATPENGYQPQEPYPLNVLADPRPQDIEPGYPVGLIKAALGAAGGVMADQWKEYFYCEAMPRMCWPSRAANRPGRSNTHGDENIITNGSSSPWPTVSACSSSSRARS